MQINFMQYNMGSGSADFALKYDVEESEDLEKRYQEAANARNIGMLAIADQLDVIFLQEVLNVTPNNELISKLIEKGFTLYGTDQIRNRDCMVAIKTDKFRCENQSFYNQLGGEEFAIVKVTHIRSNISLKLASAHLPGFSFNNPTDEAAEIGDNHAKTLVNKLNDSTITIVGVDMNSQKSVYPGRHAIFEEKGYTTHISSTYTAEKKGEKRGYRHLDYFMVRTPEFVRNPPSESLFQKIKNLFLSRFKVGEFIIIKPNASQSKWNWIDSMKNSSDHQPIMGKLTIEKQNSKIYEVWSSIRNFFSRNSDTSPSSGASE